MRLFPNMLEVTYIRQLIKLVINYGENQSINQCLLWDVCFLEVVNIFYAVFALYVELCISSLNYFL